MSQIITYKPHATYKPVITYAIVTGSQFNHTELIEFRKYRFNRIQRQYENVWLWKDINIGPHGRYIFEVEVPVRPAHWMVSSFSMSPKLGFGMLPRPIEVIYFLNYKKKGKIDL